MLYRYPGSYIGIQRYGHKRTGKLITGAVAEFEAGLRSQAEQFEVIRAEYSDSTCKELTDKPVPKLFSCFGTGSFLI
jgi:hypothetical protein